ncbi:MAG: response regulator [Candidatus Omnitrophica bacterium]|nr:response regulator [Candidatus Omnitrophota bacterium]
MKDLLVVDDDKLIRMTLKKILLKEGYKVVLASSGEEALGLVKNREFDLVISDIRMPGMDGVQFILKLRSYLKSEKRESIPEIFITAYAKEDIYKEALSLGAIGYVEKPFDMKSLLKAIDNAKRL